MLLSLYFLLLAVALIVTIFGFVSDVAVFSFSGTIMIFLLGLTLLNSGVDYKVGENTTTVVQPDNSTVETKDYVYDTYQDDKGDRYGWFLLMLGALAFILALFNL